MDSVIVLHWVIKASLVSTSLQISPNEKFLRAISNTINPPFSSVPKNRDSCCSKSVIAIIPISSVCSLTTASNDNSFSAINFNATKKCSSPFTLTGKINSCVVAIVFVSATSSKSDLPIMPIYFSSFTTGKC